MKHRKRKKKNFYFNFNFNFYFYFMLLTFFICFHNFEQENVAINLQRLTNQFQSLKKHQQLESLISIIVLFN